MRHGSWCWGFLSWSNVYMLSCFHRKILSELWWAVGSQSTNRSVTMTAAVPLLWHCMKVWSQPSTAPGPDKPKHCKGNIDPGSAVTLAGGCTEPAELILWSKDRHVMSSVQCYVHSHCTLVLRTLHAPIQTSMWITQVIYKLATRVLDSGQMTASHGGMLIVLMSYSIMSSTLCLCAMSPGPGLVVAECGAPPNVYESLLLSLPRCWCRPLAGLGTSLTTQVWSPTAAPPPPTTITTSKPSKLGTRLILPKHLDIFHILSISESKNYNA